MKNLLKKLHIVPDDGDGDPPPSENRLLLTLPGWLSSVSRRTANDSVPVYTPSSSSASSSSTFTAASSSEGRPPGIAADEEEEFQIRMALELSAREDPEAVQIEAVKQISLGEVPPGYSPAEVIAFRYWNYNALSYDDKILDGFYDFCGILAQSASMKLPSLVNLQEAPVSDSDCWEAVLVNRPGDSDLLKLEQKVLKIAQESRSVTIDDKNNFLQRLAILVANFMGGPVRDNEQLFNEWRTHRNNLRATLGSNVLPLGVLTVGLARHRALLFKVLADSVDIPCQLIKGELCAGLEDGAVNIVKLDDGREWIVDLMVEPGTLIPYDIARVHKLDTEKSYSLVPLTDHIQKSSSSRGSNFIDSCHNISNEASNVSACTTSEKDKVVSGVSIEEKMKKLRSSVGFSSTDPHGGNSSAPADVKIYWNDDNTLGNISSIRSHHSFGLTRSPSWTEGIDSTKFRKKKVKDVSKYMMDAAKENPSLAQKIHDVFLESGVAVPPNLFSDIYRQPHEARLPEGIVSYNQQKEPKLERRGASKASIKNTNTECALEAENQKPVSVGVTQSLSSREAPLVTLSSQCEESPVFPLDVPIKFIDSIPVSAAVATAAIVASSMVVSVTKSSTGPNIETAAAATASAVAAAAVIATTAVSKQHEQLLAFDPLRAIAQNASFSLEKRVAKHDNKKNEDECLHGDPSKRETEADKVNHEMERTSDKSVESGSEKSDISYDDVGEHEIIWDEIILGDRIGLGSYGEVYRGEWHGTEVAVKRFLDQDISGDALEEFKSEVRIMKRLRHPNVVLFMGAVTHVPNLSIVTEFLPRGSLYRLIHRPNNQLDERRRLKMALDVARGMNYLHSCSPVIVHRDLKSPNLLVDKNWVVKVCDFGLSRAKQNTFLSSRSTAGTAEWMAPEMLRNEPSDEKCDVFSFGVILWELCTLQQPWKGMNPMQVVGAVGFQHRCLDIPEDVDPAIADIILKCWQNDPKKRPSFSEIMAFLKPLQRPGSKMKERK